MKNINFKKGIFTVILRIAILLTISFSNLNAQCNMMGGHGSHSGNDMKKMETADTSIIRTGIIDVTLLDVNKDGYVYQDQMCWNVISDKAGDCPVCGMELAKVKNKQAIKNLKEHDFEVKE